MKEQRPSQRIVIREGTVKSNLKEPPTTERPPPPKSQIAPPTSNERLLSWLDTIIGCAEALNSATGDPDVVLTNTRMREEFAKRLSVETPAKLTCAPGTHRYKAGPKCIWCDHLLGSSEEPSACDCPEVCKVCGGRAKACALLGHRLESDRSVKWHDCARAQVNGT